MIYYKSVRCIDGKVIWVIEDEHGNISRNPTKDQLKIAICDNRKRSEIIMYICCVCGADKTYCSNDYEQWYDCKCGKKDCTKHLCKNCWSKDYQKNNPNSHDNTRKLATDWRTGNLDPLSTNGKGFIGQQIVAIKYGAEDCNLKMDNFRFYIDLSKISGYGYSEVKTSSLGIKSGQYMFHTHRPQEYDTLFLVCMDHNEPWKDVNRVYAIPWEVVVNRGKGNIVITRDSSRGTWYDDPKKGYRLDEKPFNDIYHGMKLENCKVLRKRKL